MVEKIIKLICDIIEALKLSNHLDKFVIAYIMYRQGKIKQAENQYNEFLKLKKKYEKTKNKVKVDNEYKKEIENYFNSSVDK